MTLRGKIIDLNHFKTDILSGDIEESRINFEDRIYGKGDRSNPKALLHEKWNHWEDSIYTYFVSRGEKVVCPYFTSS